MINAIVPINPAGPMQPVFRFAPSPNGALHLGHALSAFVNFEAAKRMRGRFLLRLEDIDIIRCTPDKIEQMQADLQGLGLEWEEPVMRQSGRFDVYGNALEKLKVLGLVYPSTASRKDIQTAVSDWQKTHDAPWPNDPDGSPHFPRTLLKHKEKDCSDAAWRLDMAKALEQAPGDLTWPETGPRSPSYPQSSPMTASPSAWGDVILARKDCPTSYHLSVVLDDAEQGITHVVRGQDLFAATSLHRLLQHILKLPCPNYHHHRLLVNVQGEKLSKSRGDLSLKKLREEGATVETIKTMIQWSEDDLAAFAQSL